MGPVASNVDVAVVKTDGLGNAESGTMQPRVVVSNVEQKVLVVETNGPSTADKTQATTTPIPETIPCSTVVISNGQQEAAVVEVDGLDTAELETTERLRAVVSYVQKVVVVVETSSLGMANKFQVAITLAFTKQEAYSHPGAVVSNVQQDDVVVEHNRTNAEDMSTPLASGFAAPRCDREVALHDESEHTMPNDDGVLGPNTEAEMPTNGSETSVPLPVPVREEPSLRSMPILQE